MVPRVIKLCNTARNPAMAGNHGRAFVQFANPPSAITRRARRLPVEEWTKHQETIGHLYINQEKTLEEVIDIMQQEHNFHAT
jgi:hypothetical protein